MKYYGQVRRDVNFKPRKYMYLKLQPYMQKSLKKRFNIKLSQRYYGPFKVLERIGELAYKLELPESSLLHPVFHVTTLKKMVGKPKHVVEELPVFDEEGEMLLKPKEVLRYRQQRKGRGGDRIWQVLVHWQGLPVEEATWEDYEEVATKFSNFSLEDKGVLEGGGNGEAPKRRSARIRAQTTTMATLENMGQGGSTHGPLDVVSGS